MTIAIALTSRCATAKIFSLGMIIAALLRTSAVALNTRKVCVRSTTVSVPRGSIYRSRRWLAMWSHTGGGEDESDKIIENDNENVDGGLNNLMKDTNDLAVGDWVVAKRDVPALGIRAGAVYKLLAIFLKGAVTTTTTTTASSSTTGPSAAGLGVEVIPLERYGDDERISYGSSYTKYLRVYNPRDHDSMDRTNYDSSQQQQQGVLVTPEEIGLVSVKADWTQALFLAVPGLFWVFVAMAFSNYYTDRYGGSFSDAFFRT